MTKKYEVAYTRQEGVNTFDMVKTDTNECSILECFNEDGIYINDTLIPYDYEYSKRVFFVSGINGDEFGQFPTYQQAIRKAKKMVSLTQEERHTYDL